MIRHYAQELVELGVRGSMFRLSWEMRGRMGLLDDGPPPPSPTTLRGEHLPFASSAAVQNYIAPHRSEEARATLRRRADAACGGIIRCFGGWDADFGRPIDWYRNPRTGARWPQELPWRHAMRPPSASHGDVKLTWEIGRFPHAFDLVRAGLAVPEQRSAYSMALADHVQAFDRAAPFGLGIHWASSQEVAFRLIAWLYAYAAYMHDAPWAALEEVIARTLHRGAVHTVQHIGYAKHAVHNNHLLSEALLLLVAATLLPPDDTTEAWWTDAHEILTEQAARQFYPDGGYIQQSHNYHRVALQVMILAVRFTEVAGRDVPECWRQAIGRSVRFLHAHQNPSDGRLPNYGFNDGALPLVLTSCHYSDFRPILQAGHLLTQGHRLYTAGPWDEEAAWLLGPEALAVDSPRRPRATIASFPFSGHHVLRSESHDDTFAAFRCGRLRDRFSQMDMLHLDVWWRGINVLTDPGSCQYNGSPAINAHFVSTSVHNTVTLDGHDQMHLHRRFKVLYWTEGELLRLGTHRGTHLAVGEHYAYRRHPGRAVHRRSVLFLPPETWLVVDHIEGVGKHDVRVHWLAEETAWRRENESIFVETSAGDFAVRVYDEHAVPLAVECVVGKESPLRGWCSRIYGERQPALSMSCVRQQELPCTSISLLGAGTLANADRAGEYTLSAHGQRLAIGIRGGVIQLEAVS